jgi:thymidine kinase
MKTLLLHKDLENSTKLQNNSIKKKNYFLEQLLIYGSSLAQTKSVSGKAKGWYRLPLGGGSNGKDKYLWYAAGDRGIGKKFGLKNNEILVRSIRDHDDTKFDLNPGEKKNWTEVKIQEFDNNQKEFKNLTKRQEQIINSKSNVTIIEGYPGTGKTIALLKKSDKFKNKKQIYLTYSNYLGTRAKIWFEAKNTLIENREVLTFNEIIYAFSQTNELSFNFSEKMHNNHLEAEEAFNEFVNAERINLRNWKNKLDVKNNSLLYYEIYANAFGVNKKDLSSVKDEVLENFKLRKKPLEKDYRVPLTILNKIFEKKEEADLFPNLVATRELCSKFINNEIKIPKTLKDVDVVLIDEIQDLTEIEYFFLLMYVKTLDSDSNIIVAGDESQTVKPSKFKWTRFNDTLRNKAKIVPIKKNTKEYQSRFNLAESLRSPTQIANLIHNTKELYASIDKKNRPSVKNYVSNVSDKFGRVIYFSAQSDNELCEVINAISELPSSSCIYVGGKVPNKLSKNSTLTGKIDTTETVKGLDYGVVGLVDFGKYLASIEKDTESKEDGKENLDSLRTKIDRLRVAVSRATDIVILLDVNPKYSEIKKQTLNREVGYLPFVQKLFNFDKELFSIISSKDELIEEISENISREEAIAKKIDQIYKNIQDNPTGTLNDSSSLLQNAKQGFIEHDVSKDLYKSVLIVNIISNLNSLIQSREINDNFYQYRASIKNHLNELTNRSLFQENLSQKLKEYVSKIEKYKVCLISKKIDERNVRNLNKLIQNKRILDKLIVKSNKIDVLGPSISRQIDYFFQALKDISTPDLETINLINSTIKIYIKSFIDEKGNENFLEDFQEILKKIYANWSEFSEKNAVGANKDADLEKALECSKILAELSKSAETYINVVRILRRLKRHNDALKYLKKIKSNLDNEKIFTESKRDLEDLQKILSLITQVNANGVFLSEEVEFINKQLNEKL